MTSAMVRRPFPSCRNNGRLFRAGVLLAVASLNLGLNGSLAVASGDAATLNSSGESVVCPPRSQDQIWLVDTHDLGCPSGDADVENLAVSLYDGHSDWRESCVDAFLAAQNPATRVCVLVHGARIDQSEAIQRGLLVHRDLGCAASPDQPMTFVIWSWPAEKGGRPLPGLRRMAVRSDVDGYYLAALVSRLDPNTTLDLFGYSYGARAVTGALHVISGGSLLNRTLPSDLHLERKPANVVLWTPAMRNYWLLPGQYHGRAMESTARMLIVYNSCDSALKRYHWIDPRGRPSGLGYTGLANPAGMGESIARIEQIDGCCDLGREHAFYRHLYSPRVMLRTKLLFYDEPVGTSDQSRADRPPTAQPVSSTQSVSTSHTVSSPNASQPSVPRSQRFLHRVSRRR